MGSLGLGLHDDRQPRRGVQGYASRGKVLVEIGVGMKPTPSYKSAQLVWSAPRLGLTPSSPQSA